MSTLHLPPREDFWRNTGCGPREVRRTVPTNEAAARPALERTAQPRPWKEHEDDTHDNRPELHVPAARRDWQAGPAMSLGLHTSIGNAVRVTTTRAGSGRVEFHAIPFDGTRVVASAVLSGPLDAVGSELVFDELWVAPDVRGTGIGTRVTRAAITWADLHLAAGIDTYVPEENVAMQRLLEQLGFERRPELEHGEESWTQIFALTLELAG
ncbi:hypothetical protein C5E06_12365 [Pseudoclavibacter sp. RFBI5]|nr:hypothetical protein C5E06_12365 [Pseudoclavibacter sp. RFBI5]